MTKKLFLIVAAASLFIAPLFYAQIGDLAPVADSISTSVHRAGILAQNPLAVMEKHPIRTNVSIVARHPDGEIYFDSNGPDLETNAGNDFQAAVMGGTSAQPAACNYLALTNTAITPAVTDTTLSGEITLNGLARALGTYAHTAAAASYSIAHTWTATASQSAQAAGMFNASSSGTMCFENTFTAVALSTNDTLTLTWTISY